MKIFFNLAQLYRIILGFLKPKVGLTDEVYTSFIVWPWLTEFWRVLQASEYTHLTDIARWEMGARTRYVQLLFRRRGWVVLGGQKIIYKKPIPIFSRISLSMQIVGWEDRWIYVAHRFMVKNHLHAISFVRLSMRNSSGTISLDALAGLGNVSTVAPRLKSIFQEDGDLLKECEPQ